MSPFRDLKATLLHLIIYGALLALYFVLVLRYLAHWLESLFNQHRAEYAIIAIVLMVGQAVGLEIISSFILRLMRRRRS
jgi:Kef-type K+ transport system membrane component KefB